MKLAHIKVPAALAVFPQSLDLDLAEPVTERVAGIVA